MQICFSACSQWFPHLQWYFPSFPGRRAAHIIGTEHRRGLTAMCPQLSASRPGRCTSLPFLTPKPQKPAAGDCKAFPPFSQTPFSLPTLTVRVTSSSARWVSAHWPFLHCKTAQDVEETFTHKCVYVCAGEWHFRR